ncbi:pyrroloquinoline quinone-dependent dehydrogenase [Portibacter marinus]|uniref:pyrroloquinoline quinone-dependent dehydrogenase n=1 Tax=Portibacter marinus TaxID=2898660 RepID=UPI001F471CCA|nr:pyrroloquinoline quinone-dependent dehydrogenase [Portibacter marinus]
MRWLLFPICLYLFIACSDDRPDYENWSHYLGDPQRSHYTTLDQISTDNLDQLGIAWVYQTPDTGQMQMNPIVVDGILYGVTAGLKAFALDAESGEEKWIFEDSTKDWHSTSRGVSYWEKEGDKRILFTRGDQLIALNADSGLPVKTFGKDGYLDLRTGLPSIAREKYIVSNTPGAIYEDLIVMPTRVAEQANAAPGDIRAFNIKDGSLAWTFHVIPYPGEKGYETWENKSAYKNTEGIGAGNNWAGMTVDEEEGILYVPTGSLAPDFYGGHRSGSNLYANCLLALDASTGELIWYQQLTHHDLWDRDLPAPPNLLDLNIKGAKRSAVVQPTKQGYVYVFDKYTGEPLFPIEERPVPSSNLEEAWPTQPLPTKPLPFARLSSELSDKDISPYAPNPDEIKRLMQASHRDFYHPPDTIPTLLLPGYDGAAEWGGAGVDPKNGIIYINSNEMAWILKMEKVADLEGKQVARGAYQYKQYCSSCHGANMEGNALSGYPALKSVNEKFNRPQIMEMINYGKGMMPGFEFIDQKDKDAIINFLFDKDDEMITVHESSELRYNIPYKHTGYQKFLDANGLPAISPPWGTLSAIDLNTGEYLWKNVFGEIDSLMELGHPATGSENYGGPIITENGLLIIAATKDGKVRIYDRYTGELLWWDRLPAASFATPTTYMAGNKQYLVFACGGEKLGTKPGHQLVAYAIDDEN